MSRAAERTELDLLPAAVVRRRSRGVAVVAVVIAAALGGVFGLLGGRAVGLAAAAIVGVPLLLLAFAESRRRTWLDGSVVSVRAVGTRRVDVAAGGRADVIVSAVRGQRSVSLLLSQPGGRTVTVGLAIYTAAGGVELGVLALRRLADALAGHADVVSRLLVAQLRSEARGDGMAERPLWLASGLVEANRVVRKVPPGKLAALVHEFG